MRDRRSSVQRYRDVYAQRDLVRELEDLAERAYPALTVLELDGWRLRAARGFSGRANAAWPREAGDRLGLERRLEATERFYRQRGRVPAVVVSPSAQPRGLDRALAERGWTSAASRVVQTARVESVRPEAVEPTELWAAPAPPQRWLQPWGRLSGQADLDTAAAVFARVQGAVGYALASVGGVAVGAARGVVDGGWLGVLDAAGAAEPTLTARLVRWAAEQGAERVYRDYAEVGVMPTLTRSCWSAGVTVLERSA